MDMRGHGDSDWAPDGDYSFDALTGDLRTVLRTLDEPPILIGASMGGSISLVAEGETPGLARAIVLVDIAPSTRPEGSQRIVEFMTAAPDGFGSLSEVVDALQRYNPRRPRPTNYDGIRKVVRRGRDGRWRWHWDPRYLWMANESRRMLMHDRIGAATANVAVPTLLIRGRDSDLVADEDIRTLQRLIPAAMVAEANAGHMVAGDDNHTFAGHVIDFVESQRQASQ